MVIQDFVHSRTDIGKAIKTINFYIIFTIDKRKLFFFKLLIVPIF